MKNGAVELDATILYADMEGSTVMVKKYYWYFSAKIYKSFLHGACKIIRKEGGEIVSFDGDRVMAIFLGGTKNTTAAKTALKINYLRRLINERVKKRWPKEDFELDHCVGIDTSKVRAIRTGIRGSNDLVWVGNAANLAAKLTEKKFGNNRTWITTKVYDCLMDESKLSDGKNMWIKENWMGQSQYVYKSSYHWDI